MQKNTLITLVVVVAILAALIVMKKRKQEDIDIVKEVGLVALVPTDIKPADIDRLEFYGGGNTDEKVVLKRDGDEWIATSEYDAPVDQTKIDDCLSALVDLEGELRAANVDNAMLSTYELTDDQALHVAAYKGDSDTPLFHILNGKSPDYRSSFMRTADSNDVYIESVNLRSQAGLYGEEKTPKTDTWINKTAVDLDKDKINGLHLKAPDKVLAFEKHEVPVAPKPEGEDESAEPAPKEWKWQLASTSPGGDFVKTGLDAILNRLDKLTANGVVDPAKKAEWGLEPAQFTWTVSLEDGDDVTIEGGCPTKDGDGYVHVAGADHDVVYKLSSYTFRSLFPKGASLFDLPDIDKKQEDVTRIEIEQPAGRVLIEKANDEWKIFDPSSSFPVETTKVDSIARALAGLKSEDYADSTTETGLDTPKCKVSFTADGERHTLVTGNEAESVEGVYMHLDDHPQSLVLSQTDVDAILVAPKDVFQRGLFDVFEDDITGLTLNANGESYTLTRQDSGWSLAVKDGYTGPADTSKVEALLSTLVDLQADNLLFGTNALEGNAIGTLSFTTADGNTYNLTMDAAHHVALAGRTAVFTLLDNDVAALTPASATLQAPPPPPPAPEKEAAAKDEEATPDTTIVIPNAAPAAPTQQDSEATE